jgi:uncharacterized protein
VGDPRLTAVASVVGGYVGSKIGRLLPAPVLRTGIVMMGVAAAVVMLT